MNVVDQILELTAAVLIAIMVDRRAVTFRTLAVAGNDRADGSRLWRWCIRPKKVPDWD